jgi:hypothetical protein
MSRTPAESEAELQQAKWNFVAQLACLLHSALCKKQNYVMEYHIMRTYTLVSDSNKSHNSNTSGQPVANTKIFAN